MSEAHVQWKRHCMKRENKVCEMYCGQDNSDMLHCKTLSTQKSEGPTFGLKANTVAYAAYFICYLHRTGYTDFGNFF